MAARLPGHATTTPARRLAVIRELWSAGVPVEMIGARLGLHSATVSDLARRAGLPPRTRRGARRDG